MKKNTYTTINITSIIKQRLGLQTTIKYLQDQFDVKVPNFNTITSPSMLSRIRLWEPGKQKAFYMLVGGANYIRLTENFYRDLMIVNTTETLKRTQDAPKNLENFGTQLFNIAKNTASAFKDVEATAVELSRQGLGAEQTLQRTQDALILSKLSGLDTNKSTEALTAAINYYD